MRDYDGCASEARRRQKFSMKLKNFFSTKPPIKTRKS